MDNLTHTLVGVALAESGLKRRTALGAITLVIGANFPDIDVIAIPFGRNFEWRRGTTHGLLALVVLPFVLAGIMLLFDRLRRLRRLSNATPADFRQLAILSAVSIATHPTLDFMNVYGMRWLMPFKDQWFYADGLYIVDVWILLALAVGILASRRLSSPRPARIALAGVAVYIAAMLAITTRGRHAVEKAFPESHYMVAPEPFVPWRRTVLIERDGYTFGRWGVGAAVSVGPSWDRGDWFHGARVPAVVSAMADSHAKAFLRWARYPYYRVGKDGSKTVITIRDARYPDQAWASAEVRLP